MNGFRPPVFGLPPDALALLAEPLSKNNPLLDKVYVTARLDFPGRHRIRVEVDHSCRPVFLNSRHIPDGISGITVSDVALGRVPGLSLVSGGLLPVLCLPNGERSLLTLRRDSQAPTAPDCLTEPAGRMDSGLVDTCIREGNEELLMVRSDGSGRRTPLQILAFSREGQPLTETVRTLKKEQFQRKLSRVFPGDTEPVIQVIPVSDKLPEWMGLPRTIVEIRTPYRNTTRAGLAWFDPSNRTLEFRQFVEIHLDEGDRLTFLDGETFGREPVRVPLPTDRPWSRLPEFGPLTPFLAHLAEYSAEE